MNLNLNNLGFHQLFNKRNQKLSSLKPMRFITNLKKHANR